MSEKNKSYVELEIEMMSEKEKQQLAIEEALLDATEFIWKLLENSVVTLEQVAIIVGISERKLRKLLSGKEDLTIKQYAAILLAMWHSAQRRA